MTDYRSDFFYDINDIMEEYDPNHSLDCNIHKAPVYKPDECDCKGALLNALLAARTLKSDFDNCTFIQKEAA